MFRLAAAGAVLALSCVHVTPLPFAREAAGMTVKLTVPRRGPVYVHLVVKAERLGREAFTPRFPGLPPSWPGTAMRPAQWAYQHVPGQDLELDYDIDVPPDTAQGDYPVLVGSFDTPTARHLSLGSLVPAFDRDGQSGMVANVLPVVVEIDAEEPIVTSLEGNGGVYTAPTLEALYTALALVGRSTVIEGTHGLRIASTDFDDEALGRFAALEARADEALTRSHGARRQLDVMFVHAEPKQHPRVWLAGFNRGATIAFFSAVVPDGRATGAGADVMLHELIHSYQPPDRALPHWITEGFTEYFAHRLGIALDGLPDAALHEGMEALWAAFIWSTPTRRAETTQLGDYFGGAVLAYCIDVRLRRDGSSLEQVLASTRALSKGDVANEQWEQQIALASASAGALVLGARTEPIEPVETCLREAGLVPALARPSVTLEYLARVFSLAALDDQPRHYDVTISRVRDGSPLRPGDAIIALAGERIWNLSGLLETLYRVAQTSPRGARFDVSRGGKVLQVEVDLPAPANYETAPSKHRTWVKKP